VGGDGHHGVRLRLGLRAITPRRCATATLVLNGEKIFCTGGLMAVEKSEGFVVIWATVDKSAGRAGIKAFVVEHHTPGMTVTKVEHKLGIRVSDTAALTFEDCRIPLDNLLGSARSSRRRTDSRGHGDVRRHPSDRCRQRPWRRPGGHRFCP